jgi:two-component system, NtrC family, response regulator AlgB
MTVDREKESYRLNVLIVDDEINIRKTLTVCLESRGHQVKAVGNIRDALMVADQQVFDLAFVDLRLGTENGLDLIPSLLSVSPWIKIVVITAYASVDTAVEAMRRGATDYISKPFTPDQVALVAQRSANIRRMELRIAGLKDELERLNFQPSFTSLNPGTQRALALARQAAVSEAVLLIRGASGTGKSALARAIHAWSHRAEKPFGIISCPTLSVELLESELFGHVKGAFTGAVRDNPGRIIACEGGTLFLDEISDLPLSVQPKLLRFLQDREYERVGDPRTRKADVRIIAATNSNLEQAVQQGHFREDLFYRLNVIQIDLPPLAERPEDVEKLATDMLQTFGDQNHKLFKGFSGEALLALKNHPWPGNIRELRNVVERAAILCQNETVGIEYFPPTLIPRNTPVRLGDSVSLETITENHIRRVIAATKSLQEAADILGIDQATLWRKRKLYGV